MAQKTIHTGLGSQFVPQTAAPAIDLGNAGLYVKDDENKPHFVFPNGTDVNMLPAGPGAATYGGSTQFINSLTLDAYSRITAISVATPAGGSSGGKWSFVDACVGDPTTASALTGGSFTTGGTFKATAPCTISGARIYWVSPGSAKTIKVSVWDPTGTQVATATVAVNASGAYSVTFGTPVAIGSGNVMKNYTVGAWDNSGAGGGYTHVIGAGFLLVPGRFDLTTVMSILASPLIMWTSFQLTAAGDAKPGTPGTTELYPIDITLT